MAFMWEKVADELKRKKCPSIEDIVENLTSNVFSSGEDNRFFGLCMFIYGATGGPDINYENFSNSEGFTPEIFEEIDKSLEKRLETKYPILKDTFRTKFGEFMEIYLTKCGESFYLTEEYKFKKIAEFVEELMESEHTACRHTATCAYLDMLSVAARFLARMATNVSRATDDPNPNARVLDELKEELKELKCCVQDMSANLVNRFKDSVAAIRRECLKAAADWCKNDIFPSVGKECLQKAFAPRLMDKDDSVRYKAVEVAVYLLQDLNKKSPTVIPTVENLLRTIHENLYHNTMDQNVNNALLAVEAFSSAVKFLPRCLSENVREKLPCLIYSKRREVGEKAGVLLELMMKSPDRRLSNIELLQNLVEFSVKKIGWESAIFCGLVSSSCEWILDYEAMITLLCNKGAERPFPHSEVHTILVFFGFLVQWLATNKLPPRKRVAEADVMKEPMPLINPDTDLTPIPSFILKEFPGMFRILVTGDAETCLYLIRLLQFLNYNDWDGDVEVKENVVEDLKRVIEITDDYSLIEEASRALAKLSRRDDNEGTFTLTAAESVESAVKSLLKAMKSVTDSSEDKGDDCILHNLSVNLKRFLAAMTHHDIPEYLLNMDDFLHQIGEMFKHFATEGGPGEDTPPVIVDILEYSLKMWCVYLITKFKRIQPDAWLETELEPAAASLLKLVNTIIAAVNVLARRDSLVRQMAYPIACDLLVKVQLMKISQDTVRHFVTASKIVLEKDVFVMDHLGVISEEQVQKGKTLLTEFTRAVKSGVISVVLAPPVFQHYVKYLDVYGEILKDLLLTTKVRSEVECILSIVRSLEATGEDSYFDHVEEHAKELGALFGKPKYEESVLFFHMAVLVVCLKHHTCNNRYFQFTGILKHFEAIMEVSCLEAVTQYLVSKAVDLKRATTLDIDLAEVIGIYSQDFLTCKRRIGQVARFSRLGNRSRGTPGNRGRGTRRPTRTHTVNRTPVLTPGGSSTATRKAIAKARKTLGGTRSTNRTSVSRTSRSRRSSSRDGSRGRTRSGGSRGRSRGRTRSGSPSATRRSTANPRELRMTQRSTDSSREKGSITSRTSDRRGIVPQPRSPENNKDVDQEDDVRDNGTTDTSSYSPNIRNDPDFDVRAAKVDYRRSTDTSISSLSTVDVKLARIGPNLTYGCRSDINMDRRDDPDFDEGGTSSDDVMSDIGDDIFRDLPDQSPRNDPDFDVGGARGGDRRSDVAMETESHGLLIGMHYLTPGNVLSLDSEDEESPINRMPIGEL